MTTLMTGSHTPLGTGPHGPVRQVSPLGRIPSTWRGASGGWTLIEMLVVLSLILILSTMAMTMYRNSIQTTKEAVLRSNLFMMRDAISQYYADKAKYPESLETLVSDRYIRAVPKDPITNAADWQTEPAPSEPGTLSSAAGIYDVKSAAPGVGLDGSAYSEW